MHDSSFLSVRDHLEARARRSPNAPLYHFVSYSEDGPVESVMSASDLVTGARRLASVLRRRGLGANTPVVIPSIQTRHDFIATFGCFYAGVPFVVLPPPVDRGKVLLWHSVIARCQAAAVLTNAPLEGRIGGREAFAGLLGLSPDAVLCIDECDAEDPGFEPVALDPESIAYIQYSSGSTSAPKGVVVTHANVMANIRAGLSVIEPNPLPRKYLLWAPFFHNVGLITGFSTIVASAACVWIKPMDFMTAPVRWFEQITAHRADYTFSSNSVINHCTRVIRPEQLEGLDLSSLVSLGNGSEPVDMKTLRLFAQTFATIGFRLEMFNPGYGLAESTSMVSGSRAGPMVEVIDKRAIANARLTRVEPGDPHARELVSVGQMVAGTRGIIVDPQSGERCSDGEIGELWVDAPSNARGYWDDEQSTASTFGVQQRETPGHFLRTGDLGAFLDDRLFITGRLKEVIIINGHNYYSTDIQQTIKDALPELELAPFHTFSVLREGREKVVSVAEAVGIEADRLPEMGARVAQVIAEAWGFAPEDVVFVPEGALPRTNTGKVRLLETRRAYEVGELPHCCSLRAAAGSTRALSTPENEYERRVLALFGSVLALDRPISTDENFFALGGDSMTMVELALEVGAAFDVELPARTLLTHPTVRGVAAAIEAARAGRDAADGAVDLRAECELDPSIRPQGAADRAPARELLLTGATGFLGVYLLEALLRETDAQILCLVRARDDEHAMERLRQHAQSFARWDDGWTRRVVAIAGDVGEPRLGLSAARFDALASSVGAIYHAAACVNFLFPYEGLKATNVGGTRECLRLACTGRTKAFHHVSTFSVFDSPAHAGRELDEDEPLTDPGGLLLGYSQSKWVAEKLVEQAAARGLPVTVYRPGEISGDTQRGAWKPDSVVLTLASWIQSGLVPETERSFHLTPVDFVARAIATLSTQEHDGPRVFNLVCAPTPSARVAQVIDSLGYALREVPAATWAEHVARSDDNAMKPLLPLLAEVDDQRYGSAAPRLRVTGAQRGLEDAGIEFPTVDDALLRRYFERFCKTGLIKPAAAG